MIDNYVSVYRAREREKYSERILEKIYDLKDEEEGIFKRIQDQTSSLKNEGDNEDVIQRKLCLDLIERIKYAEKEIKTLNNNYTNGKLSKRPSSYLNKKKINISDYVVKNDLFKKEEIEDLEGCWNILKKYTVNKDRGNSQSYVNPFGKEDSTYEPDDSSVDYNDYKKVSEDSNFHYVDLSQNFVQDVNLKNNPYAQLIALRNLANNDYTLEMGDKKYDFLPYLSNIIRTQNGFTVNGTIRGGVLPTGAWGGNVDRDYFIIMNINKEPEIIFVEEFSVGVTVINDSYGTTIVKDTVPAGYPESAVNLKLTIKCRTANTFYIGKTLNAFSKRNMAFEKYKINILNSLDKCDKIIKEMYNNGITPEFDNRVQIDRPAVNYKNFYNELKGSNQINVNLLNRLESFFTARKESLIDYFLIGTYEENNNGEKELVPSEMIEEFNSYLRNRMDKTDGTLINWYNNTCTLDNSFSSLNSSFEESNMLFKKLLVWEIVIEERGLDYIYLHNKENNYRFGLSKYYQKVNQDIKKEEELKVGDVVFLLDSENEEIMTTIKSIENVEIELDEGPDININTTESDISKLEIDENSTVKVKKITFNNTISDVYSVDNWFRLVKERKKN